MSEQFWLRISCPVCKSGDPRYWGHYECDKIYDFDNDVKIDINGNLFCNGCHLTDPLINWRFRCENHNFQKLENLATLLEVLQVMINMSKNINDQVKYATMVANISTMWAKKAQNCS